MASFTKEAKAFAMMTSMVRNRFVTSPRHICPDATTISCWRDEVGTWDFKLFERTKAAVQVYFDYLERYGE